MSVLASPGVETGTDFDTRFAAALHRRRTGLTPANERLAFLPNRAYSAKGNENAVVSPGNESRDGSVSLSFTDMKLNIPVEKCGHMSIKEKNEQ